MLSLFSEDGLEEHIVSNPREFCLFLVSFHVYLCVCACACMHVYMWVQMLVRGEAPGGCRESSSAVLLHYCFEAGSHNQIHDVVILASLLALGSHLRLTSHHHAHPGFKGVFGSQTPV